MRNSPLERTLSSAQQCKLYPVNIKSWWNANSIVGVRTTRQKFARHNPKVKWMKSVFVCMKFLIRVFCNSASYHLCWSRCRWDMGGCNQVQSLRSKPEMLGFLKRTCRKTNTRDGKQVINTWFLPRRGTHSASGPQPNEDRKSTELMMPSLEPKWWYNRQVDGKAIMTWKHRG